MRALALGLAALLGCLPGRGGTEAIPPVTDAGAAADAGPPPPPDAGSCVSFARASLACGFSSDGGVCGLAVTCGISASLTACQNACETSTRTRCYSEADLACLRDRVSASDCAGLANCGWAL